MVVVPAIIPRSYGHLKESVKALEGHADEFQIDLVDGVFAGDAPSWPWAGNEDVATLTFAIQEMSEHALVEVDFMIANPERVVPECVGAGAKRIVIHAGSAQHLADIVRDKGSAHVGLAFQNDDALDLLHAHRSQIDFVQCMGIDDIGKQGSNFDVRVLAKIKEIKTAYQDLPLSVDGHVNMYTLPILKAAGATRFVVGSAIFGAPDPVRAYEELKALASA